MGTLITSLLVASSAIVLTPSSPVTAAGRVDAGERRCFDVAGDAGDVAVVNVTPVLAVGAGDGALVSSDVSGRPGWSNVNYGPGTVDPNVALAPIGADGMACFANSTHSTVHVIADHLGTFDGSVFSEATASGAPSRRLDTRGGSKVPASGRRCFSVSGDRGDVAVVNVTPVLADGAGDGALVSSDVSGRPGWSNVNFGPGTVDPNVALAPIGADGRVCYANSTHTSVHVIADHLGTIDGSVFSAPTASGAPDRSLDTRASDALEPVYVPRPGCSEGNVVPLGQASGARNHEPLGAIWCFDLSEPPARTAVVGANSWVDDFTVGCTVPTPTGCTSMMSLDDRDMGYRVFDEAGEAPGTAKHWINQNHWMVDLKEGFTGGTSMRPDRSFKFENGKIVVEGDFSASIPEYEGDTWGEITITSAPAPTGEIADNLYAYGQFGGHWSVGCRLQGSRDPVCAIEGPNPNSPPSSGDCSSIPGGYRVAEMSFFQNCGSNTSGGFPTAGTRWRQCDRDGMDMMCRDRFRLEVTKNSLTLYVNGAKYFEDAGWPAAHQLPDSFVNGDVYVYQSSWQHRAGSRAYRYHWDHFAVNPPHGPMPGEFY